jgi:HK97 family phage prohead protease
MKIATRGALGVAFSIKAVDEKAHRFTGLASTWEKDLGDDVIHFGAFAKTLADWRSSKKVIPLLDSHDRWQTGSVLGKMVDARETTEGLEAEFEMVPEDALADSAFKRVKGGYIDGLSIGYEPVKFEFEVTDPNKPWDRIRHLNEVKLREVSLVVFPMNEGCRVDPSSVKSLLDAAKAGHLSDADKAELLALLQPAAATTAASTSPGSTPEAPTPDALKGLAPDDPQRIALAARLRSLRTRSLTL